MKFALLTICLLTAPHAARSMDWTETAGLGGGFIGAAQVAPQVEGDLGIRFRQRPYFAEVSWAPRLVIPTDQKQSDGGSTSFRLWNTFFLTGGYSWRQFRFGAGAMTGVAPMGIWPAIEADYSWLRIRASGGGPRNWQATLGMSFAFSDWLKGE